MSILNRILEMGKKQMEREGSYEPNPDYGWRNTGKGANENWVWREKKQPTRYVCVEFDENLMIYKVFVTKTVPKKGEVIQYEKCDCDAVEKAFVESFRLAYEDEGLVWVIQ